MKKIKALSLKEVSTKFDLSKLKFKTTEELVPCREFIGQERPYRAIHLGLGMEHGGYNIFLAGPPGVGKKSIIKDLLTKIAKDKPTPADWCYVSNMNDPNEPKAIRFPTGMGKVFKKDMEELLDLMKTQIPKAFERKEFEEQKQNIMNEFQRNKNDIFDELQKKASHEQMQLQFAPTGIITIPLFREKPISQEDYNKLDEIKKEETRKRKEKVEEEVAKSIKEARKLEKKAMERVKELENKVALFAVRDILDTIREKYNSHPDVIDYLDMVQKHMLEHIENFLPDSARETAAPVPFKIPQQQPTFTEYKVNVFIDNSNTKGAPLLFETNPTYINLFGSIEKESRFGVLVTDFTMIHAGSIAKANGGYLVVDVLDVLKYPFVWDSLKKVLENQELSIEDVYQQYGLMTTVGLRPEPIKLNLKVIMTGSTYLYHLLYNYDEDFKKLFKVKADFDSVVEIRDDVLSQYACSIKTICDNDNLNQFDRSAVEAVLEHSSRLAGDRNKLSVDFGTISKIVREASYWSGVDGNCKYVKRNHVEKAIEEKVNRSNLIEEKIQELITKGMILVDISGEVVGQINGLAVYNLGDYSFGKPSRITCETYMGMEGVISIERQAKLSGNIHDKGVLILSGYIGTKYAQKKPLSLSATLAFEQSYEMVEGDSASAAELIAIISSLSGIPIKQCLSITGSVNQKGQIQPIGGVNEKVEGYYHVCKELGLTGEQGVLIPHQNKRNLMLKKEVVQSIKDGKFHIYTIETVDQAIEILTGKEAGVRKADGRFKKGTVNSLVDNRLVELAEDYRKFARRNQSKPNNKN
ncbi:AAA family ATPase [Desulfobacterota bacterium AH_259_B03_O07]|nr:AAA family ATPase [Desulfobacterota bacterium AH_259_B03_O07]